jgi:hypothetical protein
MAYGEDHSNSRVAGMTKPDVVPVIIYLRHRAEPLRLDLLESDYDGSGPDGEGLL